MPEGVYVCDVLQHPTAVPVLGEQLRTTAQSPEPIDRFHSYRWAVSLGYAEALSWHIAIGAATTILRIHLAPRGVGAEESSGMALNYTGSVGIQAQGLFRDASFGPHSQSYADQWMHYRNPPGFSFGASFQHIGPAMQFYDEDQSDPMPLNLRLGLAWHFIDTEQVGASVAADARKLLIDRDEGGLAVPPYRALFTAWGNRGLRDVQYSVGGEVTLFRFVTLLLGRYMDAAGQLYYRSYGLSLGPEVLSLNVSLLSPDQEGHPLSNTLVGGLSLAY